MACWRITVKVYANSVPKKIPRKWWRACPLAASILDWHRMDGIEIVPGWRCPILCRRSLDMGWHTWAIFGLPVLLLVALCAWRYWSRGDTFIFLRREFRFLRNLVTLPPLSVRSSAPSSATSSAAPPPSRAAEATSQPTHPKHRSCLFHVGDCLCIANDEERDAMGVAAAALMGSANGEKADAAVVINHAVDLGIARLETWGDTTAMNGTTPEL